MIIILVIPSFLQLWNDSSTPIPLEEGNKQEKNAWEMLPEVGILPRSLHAGVLWGSKMVVWGGYNEKEHLSDGAILDIEKAKACDTK